MLKGERMFTETEILTKTGEESEKEETENKKGDSLKTILASIDESFKIIKYYIPNFSTK